MTPLPIPELRTGAWTRFGTSAVLGDAITEDTLSSLAESTRVAAGSQGYAVGWAEGQRAAREEALAVAAEAEAQRRQAEARRAAEHAAALDALRTAAAELQHVLAEVCTSVENQASELAFALTRELVGHQVDGPGIDVVRRVLDLVPHGPIARVRLHPADVTGTEALAEHGIVVLADASLGRGDALVEAEDHVLDLRLDTAMARVREALA